jgi:uncharacterized protein (DUF302 family)
LLQGSLFFAARKTRKDTVLMTSVDTAQESKGLKYGYGRLFDLPFRQVLDRTKEALLTEGFGVLFEIDLRERFREKLGTDFKEYVIIGVCNPWLAYETLQQEIAVGLLLPCNVIVYEEQGRCAVVAIDAEKMLSVAENPKLETTAAVVNERLHKVVDALFL